MEILSVSNNPEIQTFSSLVFPRFLTLNMDTIQLRTLAIFGICV